MIGLLPEHIDCVLYIHALWVAIAFIVVCNTAVDASTAFVCATITTIHNSTITLLASTTTTGNITDINSQTISIITHTLYTRA